MDGAAGYSYTLASSRIRSIPPTTGDPAAVIDIPREGHIL